MDNKSFVKFPSLNVTAMNCNVDHLYKIFELPFDVFEDTVLKF